MKKRAVLVCAEEREESFLMFGVLVWRFISVSFQGCQSTSLSLLPSCVDQRLGALVCVAYQWSEEKKRY